MSERCISMRNSETKTSQSLATIRVASDSEAVPPVILNPSNGHGYSLDYFLRLLFLIKFRILTKFLFIF